jgi:PAS domain S-box-containing protein
MIVPQPDQQVEDYRLLVEQAPLLISRHLKSGAFLYASTAFKSVLGYDTDELRGQVLFEMVHPAELDKLRAAFSNSQMSDSTQDILCRLRAKDGHFIWFEMRYKRSPDGQTMLAFAHDSTTLKYVDEALRILARGTDTLHGLDFFRVLISQVASALRRPYAFITEHVENKTKVRMLAFWQGNSFGTPFEYGLAGTPCDLVINGDRMCHYPTGIQSLFPQDQDLVSLAAQGYLGVPIHDSNEEVIGHLAVLDNKALLVEDRDLSILRIFASRAGIELERMQERRNQTAAD